MKNPVPSTEAVVRMGPEWCEHNAKEHVGSAQYNQICLYYSDCLEKVWDVRFKKLPKDQQVLLTHCLDAVDKWAYQRLEADRYYSGGGSIYSTCATNQAADRVRLKVKCLEVWDQVPRDTPSEPKISSYQSLAKNGPFSSSDLKNYQEAQLAEVPLMKNALLQVAKLPVGPRCSFWISMQRVAETIRPSNRSRR